MPEPATPKEQEGISDPSNDQSKKKIELSLASRINEGATKWMEKNRSLSLRQTPVWAQSLVGGLLAIGTITIVTAVFYKIEEVVLVTGQLKSIGGTVEVKSPIGGSIQNVLYEDGDKVNQGDLLIKFDTTQATNDKNTYLKLIAAEKSSFETKSLYLHSQIKVQNQQKGILRSKIKTKTQILSDLTTLLKQGGYQRIQILEMQDQLLELNENLTIIDEQINQLEFQLKDLSTTSQQAIEQFSKSLNDAKLQLRYQNVVAPVDGLIFDQQVSKSGVASSAERLLSIVSQKGLYAEVNIPNKDIGYIKVGQVADIRIDAFPFTQFGKLTASIESVGADALSPTQTVPFYSFKAKMKLDSDYLLKNGQKIPLKPGMAISSNLKLGSKPVISLVSDLFVRQLDSVKGIRQSAPGTMSDTK